MEACIQSDKTIINLGSLLKISNIEEQKNFYLQTIETCDAVALHGDLITSLDTASLQLLLSFILTASARNITVQWLSASAEIQHASKLLGIDAYLNLPSLTSTQQK